MVSVSSLHIFPVKSTRGIAVQQHLVEKRGLANDRRWVVCDLNGQALTAREHPLLLGLQVQFANDQVLLSVRATNEAVNISPSSSDPQIDVQIFSYATAGKKLNEQVDQWLSDYLGTACQLVHNDEAIRRPVLSKHGGAAEDLVGYADQCPVLLISKASLASLNDKLATPVTMAHFRPNIVVEGCDAFAEDTWEEIQIGSIKFRVAQRCQRCVFTTIDPDTFEKSPRQEPLRTLATFRPHPDGGVAFGVHLIPLNEGPIAVSDEVKIFL